jgi:hypothetical protein
MTELKDMKIRIESPTHCAHVQDALFAAGYQWGTENPRLQYKPCTNDAAWIFAYEDGLLTWDYDLDYGQRHFHPEYVWTPQKNFAKVVDYFKQPETPLKEKTYAPLPLKPRAEHNHERMIDLAKAILEHVTEGRKKVPVEWIEEFAQLNIEMEA